MVNQLLMLIYGLLAMSVIISLFGIVNTLVLAVYERTREIGLRARHRHVARGRCARTVRYESVITSIIGGVMGIVVGIVFAWVVTTRFAGQGITFSIPGGQLGRVPRPRRGRRRGRRDPAGAAGGADRHPRGDPLRVRGARRRSGARPPRERSRPVLGYHAPGTGRLHLWRSVIQLLDDQHWHALPDGRSSTSSRRDAQQGLDLFAVEHRRAQFGPNALTPPKGPGALRRFAACSSSTRW